VCGGSSTELTGDQPHLNHRSNNLLMRIGIFDSGLGGLVVGTALMKALPDYDFVYLGDTARVPYGDRSQETIYAFTQAALDHLFRQEECQLVIVACNTASAEALRRIQQEYLPNHFPHRRALGVIIPTAEAVGANEKVGVLATRSTVRSGTFTREIQKLYPDTQVFEAPAPLLVPLIENNALQWSAPIIEQYTVGFRQHSITKLILGCTHYGLVRDKISAILPGVSVLSQEEVVPPRLVDYLQRHPEHEEKLSKQATRRYLLTDVLDHYQDLAQALTGTPLEFEKVSLEP
jgi:glutamate racemase